MTATIGLRNIILNIGILLFGLLLAVITQTSILVSPSHPVDDTDIQAEIKRLDITFPVPELGNCANFAACHTFCEDPLNQSVCVDFAKSKGFHRDEPLQTKVDVILAAAKSELGCDSSTSCQNFCEIPANFDRCSAFAQRQGLVGGHVEDPGEREVLARAQAALGCNSEDSCRSFCEQEANRSKCSDFARSAGLRGGEHPVGPGGCTSEATCKAFCSDPNNFQICSGFTSTGGGTFSGPGGCNSEQSCRTYCQQNENECRKGFGGPGASPPPGYNPQEMCNKTPNCSWTNNGCQCGFFGETNETAQKAGEYAAFCQANPDKCKPGQPGVFDSSQQRQEFESFCTLNPDKCGAIPGGPTATFDPATQCARYGCSWTGSSCQCSGLHPYSYPTPVSGSCPAGQYIGPGGYCISEGGYSYPTPGGPYSYPTPTSYSYPTPGGPYSYPTPATSCPSGYYIGPGGYCIPSGGYSYPSPTDGYSYPSPTGTYSYPSPTGTYSYPSPSYSYPSPTGTYSYPSPSYSYPSPSYGTPSYGTPSYGTPESYGTPSYGTPSYGTPVQGVSAQRGLFDLIWEFLTGR